MDVYEFGQWCVQYFTGPVLSELRQVAAAVGTATTQFEKRINMLETNVQNKIDALSTEIAAQKTTLDKVLVEVQALKAANTDHEAAITAAVEAAKATQNTEFLAALEPIATTQAAVTAAIASVDAVNPDTPPVEPPAPPVEPEA